MQEPGPDPPDQDGASEASASSGIPAAQAPSHNFETPSHLSSSVGETADPSTKEAQAEPESSLVVSPEAASSLSGNPDDQTPAKAGDTLNYMHTAIFDPACILESPTFATPNAFMREADELFACTLLEQGSITQNDLTRLFDLLPKEPSGRSSEGQAWYTGAYMRGGKAGLRRHMALFPHSAAAFALWMSSISKGSHFTSVAVFDQTPVEPHKDLNNAPYPNVIAPLTPFQGGCVWSEGCGRDKIHIQGHEVAGGPVPWTEGVASVQVHKHWHFVLPWTGRRLVAIGFTIRSHSNLSSEDVSALTSLGFRPPSSLGFSPPEETPPKQPRVESPTAQAGTVKTAQQHTPCEPELSDSTKATNAAVQSETPLIIELCAGSAMLSAVAREHGFAILPMDHSGNRRKPYAHVLQLDLRRPESWAFVRKVVVSRAVLHIHIALPCGTCSRAREIGNPADGPPPLRDSQHVWGFLWLRGEELGKVQSANSLYQEAATFCEWLLAEHKHVGFSIENPIWSWLWQIPPVASLVCYVLRIPGGDSALLLQEKHQLESFLRTEKF